MAIKKGAPVQALDQAVASAIGQEDDEMSQRRQRAQAMTPGEKRKTDKDRKRNRAMFDLPTELEKLLDQIATELSVPRSRIATYLMIRGAENTTMEEIRGARELSRSMRYEFVIRLPDVPRTLKKGWI